VNGAGHAPRLAVVRVSDGDASTAARTPAAEPPALPSPAEPAASGAFARPTSPPEGRDGRREGSVYDGATLPTVPRVRPARPEAPQPASPAEEVDDVVVLPPAERPSPTVRRRRDVRTDTSATLGAATVVVPPEAPAAVPGPMPDGPVVLHDARGRVVAVSPEFARLAGVPADVLVGEPIDAVVVVHPAGRASGEQGEVPRPGQASVPVRLVRWRQVPGTTHQALLVVDVSDLAPAPARHDPTARPDDGAAEERRRLEELSRLAGIGSFENDRTRGTWVINSVARTLFGLPSFGALAEDVVAECVHPVDRPQVGARWRAMVEDGVPLDLEVRPAHDPSRVLHIRAARTTVGERVIVAGAVEDVTERRAMDTRMRASAQRFTDLLAVAPVGVALFDDHERLVQANQSLCRLLGEGQESLRGRRADELLDLAAERAALAPGVDPTGATPLLARPAGSAGSISWSCPARALGRRERGACGAATESVWCELHVSVSVDDIGRATHLVVFTDVTESRRVEASLRHQAMHDELTGLPNRRALSRAVSHLLAGPSARRTAVLFCDLDNFKRVNDSLGHDAGDELLVVLAEKLREGLPPGCSATRHSADEFVVVCADVDAHGGLDELTATVARILRTAVPVHGQLVRVSATIGAAVGATLGLPPSAGEPDIDLAGDPIEQVLATAPVDAPDHPATADLVRFADAALFEAKSGSNRVALADEAIMRGADEALRMESQLRQAMVNDELVLHFQPVVGPDGRVQTAEALVRWQHPEHGLIFPDKFLPIAEAADLLGDLDRWVLRAAVKAAATWPTYDGHPTASVAVNLAGLLPGDPDFLATVHEIVTESGLPWDRLVLELVETCLADLPPSTLREMNELIAAGVRFAVDDFGTGYSSLSRLTGLPAQIVKLDRGFVRGVATGESDRAVARAVVELAAAIGQTCVAEGVEDADQFAVLRDLGVDAYQGWLFARAMPSAALAEILARGPICPEVADAS
jgi:diguanylate cyclase (GGDEF)-like protein